MSFSEFWQHYDSLSGCFGLYSKPDFAVAMKLFNEMNDDEDDSGLQLSPAEFEKFIEVLMGSHDADHDAHCDAGPVL